MRIDLSLLLSDQNLDAGAPTSQRQLRVAVAAKADEADRRLPLNLCLVLDHSGSMDGQPLETVKSAALGLIDRLGEDDRLSVIAFDHKAKIIIENQQVRNGAAIAKGIERLKAEGGTAIDEGLKLGIQEAAKGKEDRVSHIFLLTDGENEHGDNDRCLKLGTVASDYHLTVHTLGFGDHWNQDVLEAIAASTQGSLSYIENPSEALHTFRQLFQRMSSVGLTNAHLLLELEPPAHLATVKPVAQVSPETMDLTVQSQGQTSEVRLGDLMTDQERVLLLNLYLDKLPPGKHVIGQVKIRYDDPASGQTNLLSDPLPLTIQVQTQYQPSTDAQVQESILTLAKYRQTQIAETKLKAGDRQGAATMLQTAAKTALQMGDKNGATILQTNATRLQSREDLSEGDRKKTRMVSKTTLQAPSSPPSGQ
jgi:Ca-activated chloride channel family protein